MNLVNVFFCGPPNFSGQLWNSILWKNGVTTYRKPQFTEFKNEGQNEWAAVVGSLDAYRCKKEGRNSSSPVCTFRKAKPRERVQLVRLTYLCIHLEHLQHSLPSRAYHEPLATYQVHWYKTALLINLKELNIGSIAYWEVSIRSDCLNNQI